MMSAPRRGHTAKPITAAQFLDQWLDVPLGCTIDRLRPSGKDTGRVSVVVMGRSLGTISKAEAERLGLTVGREWTASLATKLARAMEDDAARVAAARLLDVRPRSVGELRQRLRQKRIKQATADRLVNELESQGKLDDESFAKVYAASAANKPVGARLIEARLRQKQVAPELARRASRAALAGRDPIEDATALARKKLRTLPAKLDAPARARRLFGALARRGFDPETCRRAVRAVVAYEIDPSGE